MNIYTNNVKTKKNILKFGNRLSMECNKIYKEDILIEILKAVKRKRTSYKLYNYRYNRKFYLSILPIFHQV